VTKALTDKVNTSSEQDDRLAEFATELLQMEPLKRLTTSWLGRTGGMARFVVGASGQQAGAAILRLGANRREATEPTAEDLEKLGDLLAKALGRYKGGLMKVGQMLSYLDFMNVPDSVRAALAKLQVTSPPFRPEVVASVFESEIGQSPERAFARWSPRPFAAASIGQVHRAELKNGVQVAVKIQYPGVEKAISNDLRSASLMAAILQPFAGEFDAKAVSAEIRQRLIEECDYLLEASNQERFRALFSDWGDTIIPKTFAEFTTKRVLTTEFVRAQSLQPFARQASQARRNAAGRTIFSMVWTSILKHHCFNCDPHPGNFLFAEDKIVFLDFGCVRSFDPHFIDRWRGLLRATIEGNDQAHRTYVDALKISPPPEKRERFDYGYHMKVSKYLHRPWLGDQPFRYSHDYVKESLSLMISRNPNASYTRIPPEFVFVNRLQWGLNSILAVLGAEANWRALLLPLLYSPNEIWPEPLPE
jgi:predicted unusual protein kinase regulating ubiquinone biosynthesis (AarF/ABC1/UbiB family)